MICRIRGIVGTVTMPEFWRSLLDRPLIIMDGHIWPDAAWSKPRWSEHGAIEVDESACVECGQPSDAWRHFWGTIA